MRNKGIPAAAHSAGSSIRARRLTEPAGEVNGLAADGANPKVTVLPSHTRPRAGRDRVRAHRGTALPDRERTVQGRNPILAGHMGGRQRAIAAPDGNGAL
ncbi:hypothetical protein GCM10010249_16030 [Streptomyces roseolilacinus]|uniref:Uncharacterized protein n=1 Tax=Streptomyces roseolilacinus TaxID=66904 RepID=A0A918B168_9ACTN|nr:hypothetical protein GCM10010249_16030 [Streptomyces roseolilacinus]